MGFQISQDIRRSPSDVFAFVADFRNMPRWYEAVERVTSTTPGLTGTGARFHMVRALPGGPALNDVEITSYRQDEEVTFTSISGPTPFEYGYLVEPDGDASRLVLNGSISAEGLPGPAAHLGGLAGQFFKKGMKKNLQELTRILEASG
jgi:hypothetical protein